MSEGQHQAHQLQQLQITTVPPSTWITDPEERRRLGRRAQLLAGASVTYNVIEAVIAITAGLVAGSVALVGFGLDSVVEVSSGLIILWQFRHRLPESRERQALRLLAFSFFALAAYVTVESVRALIGGSNPETSPVGIGLAIASMIVMPFLSWAQRRTGKALGSNAVVADGTQTLLCTYLSAVLLVGLVLNATLGWGWADPIAGLVIAAVAVREGLEAWRGKGCCSPIAAGTGDLAACGCGDGQCRDAAAIERRSDGHQPPHCDRQRRDSSGPLAARTAPIALAATGQSQYVGDDQSRRGGGGSSVKCLISESLAVLRA